ncbi:N-acetyltransferase family protein [Streptomyces sp. NRAIS4]
MDRELRGQGMARRLYSTFFQHAAEEGRTEIRAITSPLNAGSIAFHRAMGFSLDAGNSEVDGLPVHTDRAVRLDTVSPVTAVTAMPCGKPTRRTAAPAAAASTTRAARSRAWW